MSKPSVLAKILRAPFLAAVRVMLSPLHSSVPVIRRAAYDVGATPYLVTGDRELFVVSAQDKTIGRSLFLHGQYDLEKLELAMTIMLSRGRQCDHLIDVGANIGSIVIPALKRGLFKSATAIEPHPENLRLLRANLALNDLLDRVQVHAVAVGDQLESTLKLRESKTNSGNHMIAEDGIAVLSRRLDDMNLPIKNSVLWMDIEGYEGHALKGGTNLAASGIPIIAEFNPSFLQNSGGLEAFQSILSGREIIDLRQPDKPSASLKLLCDDYRHDYTDILAL